MGMENRTMLPTIFPCVKSIGPRALIPLTPRLQYALLRCRSGCGSGEVQVDERAAQNSNMPAGFLSGFLVSV